MGISRRVTARYNKRMRTVRPIPAPTTGDLREQSAVSNLPVAESVPESRSDLVAHAPPEHAPAPENRPALEHRPAPEHRPVPEHRPAPAPAPRSSRLSALVRNARGRAETILRQHPRREETGGATCQLCLFAYPCDAVRIAEDVISITEKLQLGRLGSSQALLDLVIELVDLGDPPAPRADRGLGSAQLTPN
jgi:hypothetical protein